MSKSYGIQHFLRKMLFCIPNQKICVFYSILRPKNAFYLNGFVISNIYINIKLQDFKRFKTIKNCYFVDFIVIKYIKLS
jgi:hypothetical protein